MASVTTLQGQPVMPDSFDDLAVGVIGTGRMGMAHAHAWSKLGIKVFIGSRDAARGNAAAAQVGQGCAGGSHEDCLAASNFILLCIMPGPDSVAFIDKVKPLVAGQGKMFIDMSASYTRFYTEEHRAPSPYKSHLNFLKDRLADPSASWATVGLTHSA